MAPEIQLGYPINDIELSSIAGSSQRESIVTEPAQKRTDDWLSNLPSGLRTPSKGSSVGKVDEKSSKSCDWPNLPAAVLRGPPAEFVASHGRWKPAVQSGLRNNLLFAAGFLELANACDFAANVFNQIPVPLYAAILMGLGGAVALLMMYYAYRDAILSWRNLQLLRKERAYLKAQLECTQVERGSPSHVPSIQACLAVNLREIGFEAIDRFLLDTIMGFGCLVVGVGTLMAIGGANPKVFIASNLLSGYIGNSPAAIYGLGNGIWSAYVWARADTHSRVCRNDVGVALIWGRLSHRHDTVKLHAVVYGVMGLVAGAASLMTATLWYGYVMLAPCIIASAWCNWLWRHRVGYGRPIMTEAPVLSRDSILAEIQAVALLQRTIKQKPEDHPYDELSMAFLLEIIKRYDMMTQFCLKLGKSDCAAKETLFGPATPANKFVDVVDIVNLNQTQKHEMFPVLWEFVRKHGPEAMQAREKWLLELLGSYFWAVDHGDRRVSFVM